MDKDFKLDNLSKKVESMENKTRYLLDKDSVLLKDSKERLFKEVLEKDNAINAISSTKDRKICKNR